MKIYSWLELIEIELSNIEASKNDIDYRLKMIKEYLSQIEKTNKNLTFEEWEKLYGQNS